MGPGCVPRAHLGSQVQFPARPQITPAPPCQATASSPETGNRLSDSPITLPTLSPVDRRQSIHPCQASSAVAHSGSLSFSSLGDHPQCPCPPPSALSPAPDLISHTSAELLASDGFTLRSKVPPQLLTAESRSLFLCREAKASCGLFPASVTPPPCPVDSSSPWVPGPVPRALHRQYRAHTQAQQRFPSWDPENTLG